jgi:hypothetical protein
MCVQDLLPGAASEGSEGCKGCLNGPLSFTHITISMRLATLSQNDVADKDPFEAQNRWPFAGKRLCPSSCSSSLF